MIQQQTILRIEDNLGAKIVKCIKVWNSYKRQFAVLDDVLVVSHRNCFNKSRSTSKVQRWSS